MTYRIITQATEQDVHRVLSGNYERDKDVRGRYIHVRDKNGKQASDGIIIDNNPIDNNPKVYGQLIEYRKKFHHSLWIPNPQTCITGSFKEQGLALALFEEMRRIKTNLCGWPAHLFRLEDTK